MNTVTRIPGFISNKYFVMLLTFWSAFSVQAATLNQCNNALRAVEIQQLSFGDYVGEFSGRIKVTRKGVRSTTGPQLIGGTVTGGVFNVYSTRNGCRRFPVEITYSPAKPFLNGSNGGTTRIVKFLPTNDNPFKIKNRANQVKVYETGGVLKSRVGQTPGIYNGSYTVIFTHIQ